MMDVKVMTRGDLYARLKDECLKIQSVEERSFISMTARGIATIKEARSNIRRIKGELQRRNFAVVV